MANFFSLSNITLFSLISIILFLLLHLVSSTTVSTVFLFGDSIHDAGNNRFNKNCSVQANFPPYGHDFFHHPTGRWTNGRTVSDFIAQASGTELQMPYLEVEMLMRSGKMKSYPSNGINFASAGSGVLKETNLLLGVTSLQLQLQQFKNLVAQNKIDKTAIQQALYVFEAGSNDIFFYFFLSGTKKPSPDAFINAMLQEFGRVVRQIYQLGARRIAIFGLGPVGCVPARLSLPGGVAESCFSQINKMVVKFNLGLEGLVNEMPSKLHGAVGVYASTFVVVNMFLQLPQRYGFVNVSGACCGGGPLRGLFQCGVNKYELCQNPKQYVFWDYFHPTEHAYQLIFETFWNGKAPTIKPMNLKSLVNITA